MAIDEKDVAQRQGLYEDIDALDAKMDRERKAILAELKTVDDDITEACRAKDYERAATKCEQIADVFRARHFPGEAARYVQRARDYRDAARRTKQRTKKHGGRK